jgi:hypothetical protein
MEKKEDYRKYKKNPVFVKVQTYLVSNLHFNWSAETIHFFNHTFVSNYAVISV